MADKAELQQDLQDVEARIAETRTSIDELRAQVGGQGDGAQDSEDIAAALNNVEELEGVLGVLEQRRETVLKNIDEA
jgi:chromosome segregation ATPase